VVPLFIYLFIIVSVLLLYGVILWHLHKCLQSILDSPPPLSPLLLLRTIPIGFVVLFSYVSIRYIHHICLSLPYSFLPLLPTPMKNCFTFLPFIFQKETFLFVYDSYIGGFIVPFPYITCITPQVGSLCDPSLLFMVTSMGFNGHFHTCMESALTIFILFTFFILPPLLLASSP
jgi:hypothetical protein